MTFNISIILQLVLSVSLIISWYKRSKSLKKIIKKFILCIKKVKEDIKVIHGNWKEVLFC